MNDRPVASVSTSADLVSTGIGGLDHILNGGMPSGTVMLVQGAAGSGKTTAGLQFLIDGVARGERSLMICVSQTERELLQQARSHGMNLEGVEIRSLMPASSNRSAQYTIDTNESDLDALIKETYETIDEVAPDRLVYDSLLELRLLSPDEFFYRRQIMKLKQYLAGRGITSLIIDHMDNAGHDRQIEGLAHGVVSLESYTPRIGKLQRQVRVTKLRGHAFRGGLHDFRIARGGIEVFPRVIPGDLPPCEIGPPLVTGRDDLDSMLGGGLEHGSTTLIAGQSGTGKSTLSTVFATAAAEQGKNAAMFLFEERPEVYRDRSEGVGLPVLAQEDAGTLRLHHFDPAEVSVGEFSQTVLQRVEEDRLGVVVIDSLSGFLNAISDKDNIVSQVHSLVQYLARRGLVTIVTMAQHGLLGEPPRSDIDVSFIADSVILLRHYPVGREIRRTIAVLKKRQSAHERRIKNFVIAPGEVAIQEFSEEESAALPVDPTADR